MYKVCKNIKYKSKYYYIGDSIDVDSKDLEFMEKQGYIISDKEHKVETVEEYVEDVEDYTKAELQVMLSNNNIEYNKSDTKAELLKKLGDADVQ